MGRIARIRATAELVIIVSVGKCGNAGIASYRSPNGGIISAGVHGVIPPGCIVCVRRLPDYGALWAGLTRQWGTLSAPVLLTKGGDISRPPISYGQRYDGRGDPVDIRTASMYDGSSSSGARNDTHPQLVTDEYVVETGKGRSVRTENDDIQQTLRTVSICDATKFRRRNPNGDSASGRMGDRCFEVGEPGKERSQPDAHSVESWGTFPTQTCRGEDRVDTAVTQPTPAQAMVKTERNQGESQNSGQNARLESPPREDLTSGAHGSAATTLLYSATPNPSENEDMTPIEGGEKGGGNWANRTFDRTNHTGRLGGTQMGKQRPSFSLPPGIGCMQANHPPMMPGGPF